METNEKKGMEEEEENLTDGTDFRKLSLSFSAVVDIEHYYVSDSNAILFNPFLYSKAHTIQQNKSRIGREQFETQCETNPLCASKISPLTIHINETVHNSIIIAD